MGKPTRTTPSTVRRYRGAAPGLGQANELRNLLPGLVAKVTGAKPCASCGAAIKAKGPRYCPRCDDVKDSRRPR